MLLSWYHFPRPVAFALYLSSPPVPDDQGPLPWRARSGSSERASFGENTRAEAPHSEWELVDRVRASDPTALDTLVRQYFPPLVQFARQFTGSVDAAEDLVQNVLYKVWEQRTTWTPRVGIRAYLFASVRNAALNVRRHEAVIQRHHARVQAEQPASIDPILPDDAERVRQRVRQAFTQLTERQQIVLQLRYEQLLSSREIGVVLGVSTRAVERLLARAIALLQEILAP